MSTTNCSTTESLPVSCSDSDLLATAKGILIVGRGYGERQAFDELLDVAHHHHISVLSASRWLVELGRDESADAPIEWAQLLQRIRAEA
ncbi:ANTAR domain-containing protein [Rhodococcus jostii]|uniref:ANTAR domain-containing protein n=1 Tax=Rhodococcus jostii TaxID=132919 RepID=A0A1H4TQ94_RHOJO|nr:ANTAR domain-containing protein [Rhodococcus jostii]SEC58408.1 ANTAR domain-containing protein [Rhodococcus jostii]